MMKIAVIRCQDCRHWYGERISGDERPCRKLSVGIYAHPHDSGQRSELAHTRGDFGSESELWTSPEFGCTEGEPKQS